MSRKSYSQIVKILLVGEAKSQMEFQRDQNNPYVGEVIGVDFTLKLYEIDEVNVNFQIWETFSVMRLGATRPLIQDTIAVVFLGCSPKDNRYAQLMGKVKKDYPVVSVYTCENPHMDEAVKETLLKRIYQENLPAIASRSKEREFRHEARRIRAIAIKEANTRSQEVETLKSNKEEWRPRTHHRFPRPYREAMRTLCLMARAKEQSGDKDPSEVNGVAQSPG